MKKQYWEAVENVSREDLDGDKDPRLGQDSDIDSESRASSDSHSDQSQNIPSENDYRMDEKTESSIIDSVSDGEVNLVPCDRPTANSDTISTTGDITESRIIEHKLKNWAIDHNVSHSALNGLLSILKPIPTLHLPSDARTLLGTTSNSNLIETFEEGQFCYFGVEDSLISFLNNEFSTLDSDLYLNFNIDGIPLYRSSSISFWPILCTIHKIEMRPLVIAIFSGARKPEINCYLKKFSDEMKNLKKLTINRKVYNIYIRSFIADAPAKAFIKQIKQHGAYSACDHCDTVGETNQGSRSYDTSIRQLRTDEGFRLRSDLNHHTGKSPLENLHIDMVHTFPLDYMHLVLLGICRKLFHMWLSVKPFQIPIHAKQMITQNLAKCRKYLPLEFDRKPDNFSDSPKWKASECRTFLLYVGLISL